MVPAVGGLHGDEIRRAIVVAGKSVGHDRREEIDTTANFTPDLDAVSVSGPSTMVVNLDMDSQILCISSKLPAIYL